MTRTTVCRRGRATSGALDAWATVAQDRERVVAGVVPVAPLRRDGIAPDEVNVDHPGLLRSERGPRVEPARHAGLATAVGARAEPAERNEVVDGLVAVLPRDLERPALAVGVDLRRHGGGEGGAHGVIVGARGGVARRAAGATRRLGALAGTIGSGHRRSRGGYPPADVPRRRQRPQAIRR